MSNTYSPQEICDAANKIKDYCMIFHSIYKDRQLFLSINLYYNN